MYPLSSFIILSTLCTFIAADCICNFTLDQRRMRENLCLGNLNLTLYRHILSVNQSLSTIKNVSFDLGQFLTNQSSSAKFSAPLDFVAMGGLKSVNWTAALRLGVINNTNTESYMGNAFVTPVTNDLRSLAVSYGFPYGIFRQVIPQVYYLGLDLTNSSSLCYCKAGGEFTLTFTSNASLENSGDICSGSFANFIRYVENNVTKFMAAYDPFRESFIYSRVAMVERPGASPAKVYLALVFTVTTEPNIEQHLSIIGTSFPKDVWPRQMAKFGYVNLYNYTPPTTTTPKTTIATTPDADMTELLSPDRRLRVSMSYILNSFDNDRLTNREMHMIAIGIGGFVGLFLGLLFFLVCLQIRICSAQENDKATCKNT